LILFDRGQLFLSIHWQCVETVQIVDMLRSKRKTPSTSSFLRGLISEVGNIFWHANKFPMARRSSTVLHISFVMIHTEV